MGNMCLAKNDTRVVTVVYLQFNQWKFYQY